MTKALNTRQIGKRLAILRKKKSFSQEDIAQILGIPRSSVAQMELGNRNVSAIELIALSQSLGFSLDKFLIEEEPQDALDYTLTKREEKTEPRVSEPKLNTGKFKNTLLYILEQCGGKPNVGETVLYKLLYFADFNYYELYESHLTGAEYRKLPYGPVPQRAESAINQMVEHKILKRIKTEYHGFPQTRYIPLIKADLTAMSAAEKDVIDKVIERYADWSATALSEYSHKDMPWKATENGETIDYELAFYRETPYSVRTYDEASA